MNTDMQKTEYQIAVNEYNDKKKQVLKSFVGGCIELGEILFKHREVMKAENRWMEYCQDIGLHITQANDQIRLYMYAQEIGQKELLGRIITNRAKLKLFLSLPDEVQEQILQDDEISEETTSEQFRERIAKLNSDEVSEIVTDDVIPGYSESESKVDSLLDDIEGTSKFIQKENNLSKNVIPLIQGVLHIQKAGILLSDTTKISSEEKSFILEHLEDQKKKLDLILHLYK